MELIENKTIQTKIYNIRDNQVMLDRDLAKLYQVETKVLNQAVKRNIDRFPSDFMFQLSKDEFENWKSQIVTSNSDKMGLRKIPFAFTQNGIAMLSSVLKSKVAIEVNIEIMRTFTKMREFALNYSDIIKRLDEIEKTVKIDQQHLNYNSHRLDEAFELLNEILKDTKKTNNNLIGFERDSKS